MLLLWRKEEILQKLRRREVLATSHIDIFGDVLHDIEYFLLFVKLQSLLGKIAEANSIANVESATIWRYHSQKHLDKGGFARAVIADDTHLLETGKVVVEILKDDLIVERLRDILALKNLRTNVHITRLQTNLALLNALLGNLLQFIESLLTVTSLMTAGLWHTTHPFQLRAIKVVGPCYLSPTVVEAFLSLLQIIAVVAAIGIDGLVVEFQDYRTDTV